MSWHEAHISITLGELPPESFGFLHTTHPTQGRTSCSGWCPSPPCSWVPRASWPWPAVSSHGWLSHHGNLTVPACSAPAAAPGAEPSGVRGAAHPLRGASAPRGRQRCPSSAPPAPVPLLMRSENHNNFPHLMSHQELLTAEFPAGTTAQHGSAPPLSRGTRRSKRHVCDERCCTRLCGAFSRAELNLGLYTDLNGA